MEERGAIPDKDSIYEEVLGFFKPIVALQAEYTRALESTTTPQVLEAALSSARIRDGVPILDKSVLTIDYAPMKAFFIKLLAMIAKRSPQEAEAIRELIDRNGMFETLVQKALRDEKIPDEQTPILHFMLQATISPLLSIHAAHLAESPELKNWACGYCPICGGKPLVGLLRGEEGKKFLVCADCNTQWPFSRIACYNCGKECPKGASYFTISENDRYRIEVCDACKSYLKIIDQRRGHSDTSLEMENLTTFHLDIIAREKGYMNANLFMMDS